jgi:hypothetical protein
MKDAQGHGSDGRGAGEQKVYDIAAQHGIDTSHCGDAASAPPPDETGGLKAEGVPSWSRRDENFSLPPGTVVTPFSDREKEEYTEAYGETPETDKIEGVQYRG